MAILETFESRRDLAPTSGSRLIKTNIKFWHCFLPTPSLIFFKRDTRTNAAVLQWLKQLPTFKAAVMQRKQFLNLLPFGPSLGLMRWEEKRLAAAAARGEDEESRHHHVTLWSCGPSMRARPQRAALLRELEHGRRRGANKSRDDGNSLSL